MADLFSWKKLRSTAGIIYLAIGGLLLLVWKFNWCPAKIANWLLGPESGFPFLWCLAWTGIGVGAGLLNSRTKTKTERDRQRKHYFCLYYPFSMLLISLLSFTFGLYASDQQLPALDVRFYSLTALVALIGGLFAEDLGLLSRFLPEKLAGWGRSSGKE